MKWGFSILLPVILSLLVLGCIPLRFSEKNTNTFQDPFMLSDGWELYWNRFLAPGEFARDTIPTEKITGPLAWNSHGKPSTGIATYRLLVELPYDSRNCSVHFPAINSACRIWVNGILMDSSGSTGLNGNYYRGRIRSSTISLSQASRELELVVQVANYTTLTGGIVKIPFIQNTTNLVRITNITHGVQNCLIGILVAMCIYQAILFFFHRDDKSFAVLAVICLLVAIRSSLKTGESQLLSELFPGVSSHVWFKLGFLSVYSILFLFPLYIRFLFDAFAPRWPLRFYLLVSVGLCAAVLLTPNYVYGRLLDIYHLMILTAFVYAIYSVFKAFRSGNQEARLILRGVIISFPFILVEMMQNSPFIKLPTGLPFLTEIGLLTFLQFQVVLLSNRYAMSYLSLKTINQNLEVMVQERTNELLNANRIKDRLLSILSHDIKSPLNGLKGMIGLFQKERVSQQEFRELILMVEGELSKTTLLVENILSWTADQLKGVIIKKEAFDLLHLLETNIQLFQSTLENKKISVSHNLSTRIQIVTDSSILNTVIRNLLSNAIKFTPIVGKISIHALVEPSRLALTIQDSGVGMNEATLKSLINPKHTVSSAGTANERGTGLGIMLCHELLQKLQGELKIESEVNKGSRFQIIIPIQQGPLAVHRTFDDNH